MWVLGLICLGLFGYAAFKPDFAGNIAYGMGFYLIPAGIFALVFCVVSSGAREMRWQVFGFIYGSLIAGHGIGVLTHEQQGRQLADNLKQSLTTFAEQTTLEPNEIPKPIALSPATSNLEGDMGIAEVVTKTLLNDMALLHNQYLEALEGVGWMTLLDPERLSKDEGMKDSRAILTKAEAVVGKYRTATFAIIDSLPERAKQAPFRSDLTRRQFTKGAEAGREKARQNHTTTWDQELQIMHEYGAVIDLLTKRQGHYEFDEKHQVLFEEQSDADNYNAHMDKADELIQAQSEVTKRAQAEALKKLDSAW
jgi:hypothetical protein